MKTFLGAFALAALLCVPTAQAAGPGPLPVVARASAGGGAVPFFNDAVAGTAVQVKATVGQLYSLSLTNTTAATAYLQVFCKPLASVTLGTTVPDFTIRLKTNAGAGDERDVVFPVGACGLNAAGTSGTGITIAGTTTATGLTGAAISVMATYF